MNEELTVQSERVDDIPLLLAQMEQMGLAALVDKHFGVHGLWQGLSLGQVIVVWLAYILSQADHRMNQVQGWTEQRLVTLRACLGQTVTGLDLSDDRLASALRYLSETGPWEAFESGLNQQLLRVYDLQGQRVRLDSTSASGYWQVSEGGLFQFGHSKDHRPDLPQLKVMLATLDPLGLPLVTLVVEGQAADDPLYLPAIARVRASLATRGLLYIGDCKMAALATRAALAHGGDYYLCPLSALHMPPALLDSYLAPVLTGTQAVRPLYYEAPDGTREHLADGYELTVPLTSQVQGEPVAWQERRLVVRSLKLAQAAEAALRSRLAQAQAALLTLNQRGRGRARYATVAALQERAEALIERYQVPGLLHLAYQEVVHERPLRAYRDRPATVRVERDVFLTVSLDEGALARAVQRLGWRVYVTNQPAAELPLTQALLAYREQFLSERSFGRLKGQPLSLTPMYVARDDHATGLVHLLSLALRVLSVLEFSVRQRLADEQAALVGLYAGNPKRATHRPTAERLLAAFHEITLTIMEEPHQTRHHLTPLSPLQNRILALLDLPWDTYARLATPFSQPP